MEISRKMELLANLFEIDFGSFDENTPLSEIGSWDSMVQLGLIMVFKSEFDKKLEVSQLRSFEKIKDILELMD